MAFQEITDVLQALSEANVPRCEIAGFALVAEPGVPEGILRSRQVSRKMLTGFEGPYGRQERSGFQDGLEWAALLPGSDQSKSTWSDYEDERGVCVVEGEFYSPAWDRRPDLGVDRRLAASVLEGLLTRGASAIAGLNGLFSGFAYSRAEQRLWLFVDRVGARFLFYRAEGGHCEVSTNLYGFRKTDQAPRLDRLALNEHLILGSPLNGRTLVDGVRVVPTGCVVEWSPPSGTREHCYHVFPPRRRRQSLADGAAAISQAIDAHLRVLDLEPGRFTVAVSGGKDSRLILGSALRQRLSPVGATISGGPTDRDSRYASRICELTGTPSFAVSFSSSWSPTTFDWDSSILTLGGQPSWGFMTLGMLAGLHGRVILTGQMGNELSGGIPATSPWRLASAEELALNQLPVQATGVHPDLLSRCLRQDLLVPYEEVLESWMASFRREAEDTDDQLTVYLRHRLKHRSRWRAGLAMWSMRTHSVPLYPLADRSVMDAYLELPYRSLYGQAAHSLAAISGHPKLGQVPSHPAFWPLRFDPPARHVLVRGRRIAAQVARVLKRLGRRRRERQPFSPRHQVHLKVAENSGLFRPSFAALCNQDLLADRPAVLKFGATAMHVACVMGWSLDAAPPPLFLQHDPIA